MSSGGGVAKHIGTDQRQSAPKARKVVHPSTPAMSIAVDHTVGEHNCVVTPARYPIPMDVLQALDARKGDPSVSLDLLPCAPAIFLTPSVGRHPQRCFSGLVSDAL
jgi:hypothetical protein